MRSWTSLALFALACSGPPDPSRFVRVDGAPCGAEVFSRHEVSDLPRVRAQSSGEHLARLFTLYGAPGPSGDRAYEYVIDDRTTGVRFCAYSGASGPSYGDAARVGSDLRPSLEAFEALLAATEPSECEVIAPADVEYGGGVVRIGWRDGAAFSEVDGALDPLDARSYEDCLRIATARADAMDEDLASGWYFALETVLPRRFEHDSRSCGGVIGVSDDARGLVVTCAGSDEPFSVPASSGRFVPAPSPTAQLWLDSFERWRATR